MHPIHNHSTAREPRSCFTSAMQHAAHTTAPCALSCTHALQLHAPTASSPTLPIHAPYPPPARVPTAFLMPQPFRARYMHPTHQPVPTRAPIISAPAAPSPFSSCAPPQQAAKRRSTAPAAVRSMTQSAIACTLTSCPWLSSTANCQIQLPHQKSRKLLHAAQSTTSLAPPVSFQVSAPPASFATQVSNLPDQQQIAISRHFANDRNQIRHRSADILRVGADNVSFVLESRAARSSWQVE